MQFLLLLYLDKWKNHPIYVTAYSYMFGALFMALTSIYYLASGKADRYLITGTVRLTILTDGI